MSRKIKFLPGTHTLYQHIRARDALFMQGMSPAEIKSASATVVKSVLAGGVLRAAPKKAKAASRKKTIAWAKEVAREQERKRLAASEEKWRDVPFFIGHR